MNRLFLFPLACAALSTAQAADILVAVQPQREAGMLHFALFDREQYLSKPIATVKSLPEKPAVVFRNLMPGTYALSVFQDLNGNGELDRNLLGAPTEPYGFSNDAAGMMGPPKFDAAAVQVDTENRHIAIKLR